MSRKLTEDETTKLVHLYGENECLWDIKSPNYRNKDMRATALQNIAQQMQIEGLTPNEVKNKIKSIRSTYYLETDKILKSSRSGASGNVYVPKIKWFQELDAFIKNVTVKRKTTDNYEATLGNDNAVPAEAEGFDEHAENVSRSTENNDDSSNISTPPVHAPAQNSGKEAPTQSGRIRSKRSKLSQMASMIKDMKSVSNDLNMSPSVEETDFDIFGKHVAAQLKKLSEEQSVIAQEEIQKILSKCRLIDIQKRTNLNIFSNVQFSASQPSPQAQYYFTPSPAATTSSNSSLGFYSNSNQINSPEYNEITTSSHSSLGLYPPEQISMTPTYVDPSQIIIRHRVNNSTMNNNEPGSENNAVIVRAFENA